MTPAELDALLNEPNEEYFNWNADWGLRAAAALVQLREENTRLDSIWDSTIAATWLRRAERAEAEVARLISELRLMAVGMKAHQDGNKQATDRAKRAEQERDEWKILSAADRVAATNAAAEVEQALSDPMNVGWQRAQNAIKDRAATVSQWKAANQRIAALEAERDALAKDAERWQAVLKSRFMLCDFDVRESGHFRTTKLRLVDAAIDAAKEKP